MIRRNIPKKTKQIGIRFSEDEKQLVEKYVQDNTHADSVSEWIRELVFREIESEDDNRAARRAEAGAEMRQEAILDKR